MTEAAAATKYTARAKLFADGAKGYKLQVHAVMADGEDIGIDMVVKCEDGAWSKVFASEQGEFPTLAEALKAKEAQARDDEWDAAAPTGGAG